MENIIEKNHLLSLPEFVRSKKYWQEEFDSKLEATRLPYSYFQTLDYEEQKYSFSLDTAVLAQLEKASKGNLEAMFIILVASYRILLYKYLGQQALELGIPTMVPKNQAAEFFTAQLLPVYTKILPEYSFKQVLKAEKEKIAAAYQHQHYPLQTIDEYKTPKTAVFFKNIHPFYKATECDFVFEKTSEGLEIQCVYNAKLFSQAFIQNFTRKYQHTIRCLLSSADVAIDDLSILEAAEENMLLHVINDTGAPYPSGSNLVRVFGEWVRKTPDAAAVVSVNGTLTFSQLDIYSDKIANYLVHTIKIANEEQIGILLPKSHHTIACMLGILKAGGSYLPISPRYPADRIRMILNDSRLKTIISSKAHIKLLNKLQWECASFQTFLCIDSLDCHLEKEETSFKNELNSQNLWEHVGEKATDDIEGGGWQNSYTGENLSRAEMNEYRDNIINKLTPLLHTNTRVLEIGCASGISMFELAPKTGLYYGTDISRVIIEKNRQKINREGIANIKLKSLAAHEIDQVEEKNFDVVIINSVIQCFEGHNYLRDVLRKVVHLMKDTGIIFLGDIMDEDTREVFIESLNTFKKSNLGKGYKVKTDFSNEIFYSRSFLEDLRFDIKGIHQTTFSEKIHTIENELTKYRYDAMLFIDKKATPAPGVRHKYQHSLQEFSSYSEKPFVQTEIKPDAAAHVIYTSGSTGKPKGVIVTHRNVLRMVQNTNCVKVEPGEKMLQTGAMEFDASTFEIWTALTNGASLHIIDSELLLNAERLKKYIAQNQITISFVITAAFNALVEQDVTIFDGLNYVLTGGEAMSTKHINKFLQHNQSTKLYNLYGPTENTVVSTAHLVNKPYTGAVPIGKPIHNSTCYVLDTKQRLVIPGAEGVLYVGGDGVAKGYLNSPELTQQRFVQSPFKQGEILYNTGDLVRFNEEYALEFLGRVDTQVKVRGFRIELSEIENELLHINGIKEARVVVTKDQNDEKSLTGYFTASTKMDPAEVAYLLGDKLPDYMIPSALMQLDELPLNANGKLNMLKLPDPISLSKSKFEAPANETERQLVEIWKEVLGVSIVSVHDNFFDMGGHSLKAMKVLHKLSKDFELKLTTLFRYPTIRELAQNLVYKKGNLLETLQRLKKKPLNEADKRKAEERKVWYKERMKKDNFQIPGEQQEIREVLLTGSTGYLGIHLLYELLTTTTANVYLLIRAENEAAAKGRLLKKISFFFGSEFYDAYKNRIHPLAGEMEKPFLGLHKNIYKTLEEIIDTIVNPAANVKHYGLEVDYKGNTTGVQELVNLAKSGRPKRIHHVSTAGVSFGQEYVFSEYDRVEKIPDVNNTIYLQSKLDAENIIFKAIEEGVEASIYRAGNLVFNNDTGKFQENTENSAFYMLLRSFINLGIMPDMRDKFYDFSFINTTAEAIIKFAKEKSLINNVFYVYNTHTYSLHDLYHQVVKPHFPQVKLVSLDEFAQLVMEKYEDPATKEFIEHILVNIRILEINESSVMLVSDRSQAVMDKLQINWQELNEQMATMMVTFGKEKSFW
ncbi:AMP-binding protein [Rhodocytophaga aerolata]|uniref:AMP-binding protein n=1 Tax=Rhodocytophaga aerolata TaxID=455078 RepID=A0ABT8RDP3_9BACT|nr:AMP-binding protein [Rhodocytophaga aerolata]MDO1450226.1 AMP-binding protein [Rhodocytophaga aerolata]